MDIDVANISTRREIANGNAVIVRLNYMFVLVTHCTPAPIGFIYFLLFAELRFPITIVPMAGVLSRTCHPVLRRYKPHFHKFPF